jgi:hypothetical protein
VQITVNSCGQAHKKEVILLKPLRTFTTVEELVEALKSFKNEKRLGTDGVSMDVCYAPFRSD